MALIAKMKFGIKSISIHDLTSIGWKIQQACNDANIDALIERNGEDFKALVYDMPDYFKCDPSGIQPTLIAQNDIEGFRYRFVGYLPSTVLKIMNEQICEVI